MRHLLTDGRTENCLVQCLTAYTLRSKLQFYWTFPAFAVFTLTLYISNSRASDVSHIYYYYYYYYYYYLVLFGTTNTKPQNQYALAHEYSITNYAWNDP